MNIKNKFASLGVLAAILVLVLVAPYYAHAAGERERAVVSAKCIRGHAESGRWYIGKDMNCDGEFTITDVEKYVGWAFYLPGDFVLAMLMKSSELATFFEMTPDDYGNWVSSLISFLAWLFIFFGMALIDSQ